MDFVDLYRKAEEHSKTRVAAGRIPAVPFVYLKNEAIAGIAWLHAVNVYPISTKEGDPLGHYECHSHGTESAHEPVDSWVALITYDDKLDFEQQRFVQTKELMHLFDSHEGSVKTADEYRGFISEIEVEPPGRRTEAYTTENDAKWKALLCLCPQHSRNILLADLNSGKITAYDLALAFRIPEALVTAVISPSYDVAFQNYIVGSPLQH
jgi:hypothetical protein